MRLFQRISFLLTGLLFADLKGSRPLLDVPSQDVLGAVNPNEEVAGPHSPSTSGARRPVWGSPTVARSFISAAAVPFFMCDSLGACSRRRTIVTSRHLVKFFSIHCSFFSFIWCSLFTFSPFQFRTHAALMAILAFKFLARTSLFVHGHHAFRNNDPAAISSG